MNHPLSTSMILVMLMITACGDHPAELQSPRTAPTAEDAAENGAGDAESADSVIRRPPVAPIIRV